MYYSNNLFNFVYRLKQNLIEVIKFSRLDQQPNNPLHGIKLADILDHLVKVYGWNEMGTIVKIKCFNNDPSIKSSLKFLRRTDWARQEVETLYLKSLKRKKTQTKPPAEKSGSARKFGRKN